MCLCHVVLIVKLVFLKVPRVHAMMRRSLAPPPVLVHVSVDSSAGGAGDVPPEGVLPAQLRVVGLDLGPVSSVAGAHKLILAAPLVIGLAVLPAHHTWKPGM